MTRDGTTSLLIEYGGLPTTWVRVKGNGSGRKSPWISQSSNKTSASHPDMPWRTRQDAN